MTTHARTLYSKHALPVVFLAGVRGAHPFLFGCVCVCVCVSFLFPFRLFCVRDSDLVFHCHSRSCMLPSPVT